MEVDAHVLLPEVVVEDVVLLVAHVLGVVMTQYAQHLRFGGGTLGVCQLVVEQVVSGGVAQGDAAGREVVGKQFRVCGRRGNQGVQQFLQFVGISALPGQHIGMVQPRGVLAQGLGAGGKATGGIVVGKGDGGTGGQSTIFGMRGHVAACGIDAGIEEAVQARIDAGRVLQESFKGRRDERRQSGGHFEAVGFTPCAFARPVRLDVAETPIPRAFLQRAVQVVHAPRLRFGQDGFRVAEVLRARQVELQALVRLHGLGHDEGGGIHHQFVVRLGVGLRAYLVPVSVRCFRGNFVLRLFRFRQGIALARAVA